MFWEIVGTILASVYFVKCTPLWKELRQRFFELDLEHCTLTENPLRRLILFNRYCNFNRLRDQMMCDICGMHGIGGLGFPRRSTPWPKALTLWPSAPKIRIFEKYPCVIFEVIISSQYVHYKLCFLSMLRRSHNWL